MRDSDKLMWAIEEQLRKEQEELEDAENITKKVYPILDKLEKRDIINEVKLYLKLYGLEADFRLAVYYLFRIAVERGPDGSFIVLDPQKARFLANDIQKKRLGLMSEHRLKVFCSMINHIISREMTKPYDGLVFGRAKAQSLGEKLQVRAKSLKTH